MSERLIVRVDAPIDHPDMLRVEDAFEHILELFELAKASSEPGAEPVVWRLVGASMNSPLTVIAEAVSPTPGKSADAAAREQKKHLARNMKILRSGQIPSQWSHRIVRDTAKRFAQRSSEKIGRLEVVLNEAPRNSPDREVIEVTNESFLRTSLIFTSASDAERIKPKNQIGSLEGFFLQVTTYHHKPAIVVKSRRTGKHVTCIISEDHKNEISKEADFNDVWTGRRIVVSGRLEFDQDGELHKVIANSIRLISPAYTSLESLRDEGFTEGLSASDYLNSFREGNLG